MKFSLAKAVPGAGKQQETKRPAEEPKETRRSKVLKVSDVVVEAEGPKPTAMVQRKFASNAPANLVIFKMADHAGDVWDRYKGSEEPLWAMQLSQDSARPSARQPPPGLRHQCSKV